MNTETIKIKNGIITLPETLRKSWKAVEAFIFPTEDTLIVKKVQQPLKKISALANRISQPKMTQAKITKEVQQYRKNK